MRSQAPPLLPILRSRHQGELLAVLLLHLDREYPLSELSCHLLVIGQPDRTQLYEAADRAERRLDLPVDPTVRSRRRWSAAADPLVRQIQSSPLVWVLDRANLQGAA